jgi:hypothetical protein
MAKDKMAMQVSLACLRRIRSEKRRLGNIAPPENSAADSTD